MLLIREKSFFLIYFYKILCNFKINLAENTGKTALF